MRTLTRRRALPLLGAAAVGAARLASARLAVPAQASTQAPKPDWSPLWQDLRPPAVPEWFRDAKFGIFFHWGLYSVPAFGAPASLGEWYSHHMYLTDTPESRYHREHYGPLSTFGYKDFAPLFTAEHWSPDSWLDLFQQAGARYVGMVAEHADGFAMWDSKANPHNAARVGPRRDLLAEYAAAVRKRNLKLLTSLHHHWLWGWYASQDAQADIYKPENASWYWPQPYARHAGAFRFTDPDPAPTGEFNALWLGKFKEVTDRFHPDVIYLDSRASIIPEPLRYEALNHFYEAAFARDQQVLLTYKNQDFPRGSAVYDCEAGQLAAQTPFVWQTDDVLDWSSWAYMKSPDYKSPERVLRQLIDIVSKNGNLLLDVGPRPDGTMPEEIVERLRAIGSWLAVNGEAIYGSRPWTTFGEGPTVVKPGEYVANHNKDFGPEDIRFTSRDGALYLILMAPPESDTVRVSCVRRETPLPGGPLRNITAVDSLKTVRWRWAANELTLDATGLRRASPSPIALKLV